MSNDFDPAPNDLAIVTSPEWLQGALRRRWPELSVRGAEVVEVLATQATKVRIALTLENAPDEAPRNVCIEGILTDTGAAPSASITETLFYQTMAADMPVRTPPCVYAELKPDRSNGVVMMKDLIADGGQFLSALTPFTLEEAREGLDQLAMLHAVSPAGSAAFERPWIGCFLDQIGRRPIMPVEVLQGMMDGPRGELLPAPVKSAERLNRGVAALAAEVRERPQRLLHGDAHAGNVFRWGGGLGLVDWQILQKGEWAMDVCYHLTAVLSPEDRRAHERDLLTYYLERLRELGGPAIEAEEAWTRYRADLVYGYYLWAITRKVVPEITNEFNRRLGLAVAELESFELLGV